MTLLDRPRMSWLIQSGVFAVIAAMCGYFAAVELQPAFGLASSQQVKDFGVVRTGEICKAIFDIRNVGSAAVEIMEVIKGCTCTNVTIDKSVLAPRTAGSLVVTMVAGNHPVVIDTAVQLVCRIPGSTDIRRVQFRLRANVVQ